jgi:hypothetical protein
MSQRQLLPALISLLTPWRIALHRAARWRRVDVNDINLHGAAGMISCSDPRLPAAAPDANP